MNKKLFQLFITLSVHEITLLGKFLNSPYFNNSKNVLKLFYYLKKCYPTFTPKRIQQEIIFTEIFPEEKFRYKKITDLISDLYLLLEQFLVIQDIKKLDSLNYLKVKALEHRNVYSLYKKKVERALKKIDRSNQVLDMDSLHQKLELTKDFYLHPLTQPYQRNLEYPIRIMETLDAYFILGKLKFGCELLSRQKTIREVHEPKLLDEVIALSEVYNENDFPLINIYKGIISLLQGKGEDYVFGKVIITFKESVRNISIQEARGIFQYLINYTIGRIKSGKEEYKLIQFNLFNLALENHILLLNNFLSDITFINIIILGADLNKFTWVKKFIKDHHQFLDHDDRDNAIAIGNAFLHFAKKQFEKVIILAKNMEYPNYRYKLLARSIILRASFELALKEQKDFINTLDLVNSFEVFIKRSNTIPNNQSLAYKNYLIIVKELVFYYLDEFKDKQFKPNLLTKLNSYDDIIAKSWLLIKVDQLK